MARDGVCEVLMKGRPRQRGRGPRPPEMLRAQGKSPPESQVTINVAKVNNSSGSKPQQAGAGSRAKAGLVHRGWNPCSHMEGCPGRQDCSHWVVSVQDCGLLGAQHDSA